MSSKEDYLKRYLQASKPEVPQDFKEKKTKKKRASSSTKQPQGLRIVDQDLSVKPKIIEEEELPQEEEDTPIVVSEVQEKAPQQYLGPRTDGSGWTVVRDSGISNNNHHRGNAESEDVDVPRKRRRRVYDSDEEEESGQRQHRDHDLSPPRRTQQSAGHREKDHDVSPPRRQRAEEGRDLSPPRASSSRTRTDQEDQDLSPARKSGNSSGQLDLSPPRRGKPQPQLQDEPEPAERGDLSPARRSSKETMSSGIRTGLLSGKELVEAEKAKKAERDARFATMDPTLLGKGAQVVYRDSRGKKLSMEEIIEKQLKKQQKKQQDDEAANMEWGVGLVQKKQKEDQKAYEEREKLKPFARTAEDEDLNSMQKDQDRWGDPMLALLGPETASSSSKKEKKDKKDKKHKKKKGPDRAPMWKGPAPANRFNILPGYRWDGVDRSNGFEKKLLSRQAEKVAKNEEAYLWSVEDM